MAIKTDISTCSIQYAEKVSEYMDIIVEDGVAYMVMKETDHE